MVSVGPDLSGRGVTQQAGSATALGGPSPQPGRAGVGFVHGLLPLPPQLQDRATVGLPGSGLSYTQTSPRRRGPGVGPVVLVIVAVIVILAIAGTAAARTCYTLLDRNDNVVYRDTFPPVDLRDQGEAARAQLRQRGEFLLISEEEQCQQVTFVSGPGGATALSVDDFLGGLQPSTRASGSTITTAPQGARGPASSAPSAPSAAPKRGSASGGYK